MMSNSNRGLLSGSWLIALLAVTAPSLGQPDTSNGPASPAQSERNEARWTDLEAQRRATEGDYDGAVQAHQQAEQELQEARRLETIEDGRR